MRKLDKTETASRSIVADAESNTVTVSHTVKPDANSDVRYQLEWTLNFADVTQAELLEMAARTMTIRKQAEWRKASNQMDENAWSNGVTISIREMLDAERSNAADPLAKAKAALSKLDAATRTALLAELSK